MNFKCCVHACTEVTAFPHALKPPHSRMRWIHCIHACIEATAFTHALKPLHSHMHWNSIHICIHMGAIIYWCFWASVWIVNTTDVLLSHWPCVILHFFLRVQIRCCWYMQMSKTLPLNVVRNFCKTAHHVLCRKKIRIRKSARQAKT